jgi:hypothetical protein
VVAALNAKEASIPLKHSAGLLPDLTLNLRMWDTNIINVKWTWTEQPAPAGKRQHFEVPSSILDTSKPLSQTTLLSQHVSIVKSPFHLNFTRLDAKAGKETYLQFSGMIYDSYLNWVAMRAWTATQGDDYRGVLGLGERS